MYRTLFKAYVLSFVLPLLLVAQDGKLRGRVTDRETGDPLIGANVLIEGTSIGSATDINGEYIILSVPPGVYTLRVSYIGYAPTTIANIRVSANLTTTQDVQLVSTAIQTTEIEVVAERPLIQRNTTNTVRISTQEDVKSIPFRGLQNLLALNAGVVQQNGILYVRGGRAGEVAYYVDGATATNPLFNSEAVSPIREAIEEFQLQAGGFTAEFGGASSGVVRTVMRTGGPKLSGSVDYLTDDFAKPGEKFLGTTANGYRNAAVTFGGPLMRNFRFFLAGQHNYQRNRSAMFLVPFRYDSLLTDDNDPRGAGIALPGPLEFKENYLYRNYRLANTLQGTLLYDMMPLKFRFTGSYDFLEQPEGRSWPDALQRYYRKQGQLRETDVAFANLRMTHVLGPTTFYELGVSYYNRFTRLYNPEFGDNWEQYADSAANAAKGFTDFQALYRPPLNYSVISGFTFLHENAPINAYSKNHQTNFGASADITSQIGSHWELKAGGRLDAWTVRNFSIGNIAARNRFLYGERGNTPQTFVDANERRVRVSKAGVINHYGYDVDGNETDSGFDAPPKPLFASAYIQNKFEYQDLILNVGVRYEHFDTDYKSFPDPLNPAFDDNLDVIDENALKPVEPFQLLLPRFNFSFPVTDKTVFYAQYGKYAQMPSLNQLFVGNTTLSRSVSPITRGNAFLTPVGFFMKPERLTQFEMGFRQLVSDNFAFTLSGFYKDMKDQLQVRLYAPEGTRLFIAYLNEDFGTVKGLELTLELRRTNRLSARVNYTLSDARGTGSDPRSAWGAVEQNIGRPINIISPLEFNQTHRGSAIFEYRFERGDGGPILEGLGANLLFTFNSGHAYTKIKEPQDLGQADRWNVGVRPLIDPRSSFPVEPINASTTPWVFNVDLNLAKTFYFDMFNVELYVNILNLFNTKHIINVYPSTGTAQDDGWLGSPLAAQFESIPGYAEFYRNINLNNRWAYMDAVAIGRGQSGSDLYGMPRQIRVGLKVEL